VGVAVFMKGGTSEALGLQIIIKITNQAIAQLVMALHVKFKFKMTIHYGNCCVKYIDIIRNL
jgi:hypothetical protein